MGSKNRIYLGLIIQIISHYHSNKFDKSIYMSKLVQAKIKVKHKNNFNYTNKIKFKILLKNTIASSQYGMNSDTINFIAHIESTNKYILYSLKKKKHHTICSTIFSLRKDTLKKYYQMDNFKVFRKEYVNLIEEYIN